MFSYLCVSYLTELLERNEDVHGTSIPRTRLASILPPAHEVDATRIPVVAPEESQHSSKWPVDVSSC